MLRPSPNHETLRLRLPNEDLYIYNSVLTCRQNITNSSASGPLNATKIAVKKVSDVDVCMFGPELLFLMYKCCFLASFCASQRVQRQKAELTLAQIREKLPNVWADWHQIWHTCANSYGNGYTLNKLLLETQGRYLGGLGCQ